MNTPVASSAFAPFRWPDFRSLFVAAVSSALASRALAIVLSYEVYSRTGDVLALGGLGLVEAIPALPLALYGGHIADRTDRRRILRTTLGALVVCAMALAALSAADLGKAQIVVLYAVVFIIGIARGFAEPAAAALEAQVVPLELLIYSSTMMASSWMIAAIIGPLAGGLVFDLFGASWTYLGIGAFYAVAWIGISRIRPRPVKPHPPDESVWESVAAGVRYVVGDQILLGSMALDLFAVFFGGAVALFPVFNEDIFHGGPRELGIMNAAPVAGTLLTVLLANRHPPVRHAGRNLFLAVAGFGVSIIVFALSRSFPLSIAALFFSGACDGISVVIRRGIVRILSPEHLRGRIASVSMIFIGSSNELGAFESGVMAKLVGTVPSVWIGGIVTLIVTAAAAVWAPKLRHLSLDPSRVVKRDAEVDQELDADSSLTQ